ncbi:MAG TPA: dienelactone hydrolase family protein [Acidimicrobiales bacterium]|nr:dienelactone hydrolase family protein [Acidimicrobiales bacterium]
MTGVIRATTDVYPDVTASELTLRGGRVPALLYRPSTSGPRPGLVIGAEAFGINDFIRRVAATLAHAGYVTLVPDYYRGSGPAHPERYDDFAEVVEHIGALDFVLATGDTVAGVEHLRRLEGVDPERVGVWGYCTGGTLALLAACVRPDVAASVLFFPSQPVFHHLDAEHPVHPIDLLWSLRGPSLFLYGDEDPVMGPELLADLRGRLARWDVDATVITYPGAGHAFCAPVPPMRHDQADRAAWADAVAFAARHLRP